MKDHFQQLDELLKQKSIDELTLADKTLLQKLRIDLEGYAWLRKSKMVLNTAPDSEKRNPSRELDQAFEEQWGRQTSWSRIAQHQLPLWQVASGFLLLLLGMHWYSPPLDDNHLASSPLPTIVCQTDTLIHEIAKTDTIYLIRHLKINSHKTQVIPESPSPPVAATSSRQNPEASPITEITRLEEIKTSNTGSSLKEHPELEVFFTDDGFH